MKQIYGVGLLALSIYKLSKQRYRKAVTAMAVFIDQAAISQFGKKSDDVTAGEWLTVQPFGSLGHLGAAKFDIAILQSSDHH